MLFVYIPEFIDSRKEMDILSGGLYTSKIIKAGALIDDTKTMLANWDISQSVQNNLTRLSNQNIFGKATRSRIKDILGIFRQRYLMDPELIKGLLPLLDQPGLSDALNRILFFFAAQNDRLLHAAVIEFIAGKKSQGIEEITTQMVIDWIKQLVAQHKTTTLWSEKTILRCSQELLSTMRDFGVLEGASTKHIAPFYLPLEAFVFIAFYENRKLSSGERLIHDPEWNLFFLSEKLAERLFLEAHQHHLLEYYAAGSVVRLTFPTKELEEYARVIAQRTH
jgi:hypothetical protein